jgi:hypothetical protein
LQVIEISGKKFAPASSEQKEEVKQRIKKIQKEGEKLRKGMFEFIDAGSGWLDFCYRFYPGEPIRRVKITHGEICDLPSDVVKHLNNCYKKVRMVREKADEGVDQVMKTSRCRFTPMDAM